MDNALHLWDFDETLARSCEAVDALKALHPGVPTWKFWHDATLSSAAAANTAPIVAMWDRLAATPGEHRILTGRCAAAVHAWLALHPCYAALLSGVASTSEPATKHLITAVKKASYVAPLVASGRTVIFYDDSPLNVSHVAATGATALLVVDGAVTR